MSVLTHSLNPKFKNYFFKKSNIANFNALSTRIFGNIGMVDGLVIKSMFKCFPNDDQITINTHFN